MPFAPAKAYILQGSGSFGPACVLPAAPGTSITKQRNIAPFMEHPGVPERSPEAKTERGMDFSVLRIQDPQPHILSLKYSHSSERWEFYV